MPFYPSLKSCRSYHRDRCLLEFTIQQFYFRNHSFKFRPLLPTYLSWLIFMFLLGWSNISQHALNTVFALFDILFTHAGPHPWTHLPFLIIILALYLAVAYITHATEGFYSTSKSIFLRFRNLKVIQFLFSLLIPRP